MPKLTVKTIDAARESGRLYDEGGLTLHISKNQSKRWVYRYMMDGRRRDMGLGSYPAVSLAEARLKRDNNKRLIAQGVDPIEAKRASKLKATASSLRTFDSATEECIRAIESRWSNAKHRQQWINTLKTYASPVIGQLDVAAVDTNLVLEVLQPIWTEKNETASRVRQRIEAVINWSIAKGLRTGPNPASWNGNLEFLLPASNKVKTINHHRAPSKEEAQFLYCELTKRDSITAYAFQYLMLTACRTSEVTQAQWCEVDFGKAIWTVPSSRMKSRIKHVVPLTDEMLVLLERAKLHNSTPFIFPGKGTSSGLSGNAFLQFLKKQIPGFSGTPHGIRSTFRDWAEEQGVYGHRAIETALAHELRSRVEKAYLRTNLLEQRRVLMSDWARFLSQACVS